jgi:molybdopterin converting factor small subunit
VRAPAITVDLPVMLRELTGIREPVEVDGDTIHAALNHLGRLHPALGLHLFDENGRLRRHLMCFFNDEFTLNELNKRLHPGDHITLVHKVSGG